MSLWLSSCSSSRNLPPSPLTVRRQVMRRILFSSWRFVVYRSCWIRVMTFRILGGSLLSLIYSTSWMVRALLQYPECANPHSRRQSELFQSMLKLCHFNISSGPPHLRLLRSRPATLMHILAAPQFLQRPAVHMSCLSRKLRCEYNTFLSSLYKIERV